jgi:hypothetical protein
MIGDEFDDALFDHLVIEFRDHGRRAVDFLRTAKALLAMPSESLPRHAALVGYCLREAMKAIPESQDSGGPGRWRQRSRRVLDAKQRFELIRGLPGEDSDGALSELLATIDEMARTHEQDRIHQQRLIAVMVNRTGAEPLASGTNPVRTYQKLIDRCDQAVHGTLTFEEAPPLLVDCMAVLRQLFMPPDLRHRELDTLAARDRPSNDDVRAVLSLVAGPNHLRYFLSRIQTSTWLDLLDESGMLAPPTDQGAWPVFAAVDKLKDEDPAGLAALLGKLFVLWGGDARRAWYIARAAVDLGLHGNEVVLRALRRHPASPGLIHLAVMAASQTDPASVFVESVADLALNQTADVAGSVEPLVRPFTTGVTAENYVGRIRLLCFKLGAVPADDRSRRYFGADRGGSIADRAGFFEHDHFSVLLYALIECLTQALNAVEVVGVLDAIKCLPSDVVDRVRVWVLAQGPAIEPTARIAEITRAIGSRQPTGDDLRLVDLIVAEADPREYAHDWTQAMPAPPPATALGSALAAGKLPDDWRRAFEWYGLLPAAVKAEWSAAVAVLSGRYGEPSLARLGRQAQVEFSTGRSPLTEDEIRTMAVDDATRQIASWRPDSADWLVSARELGRTLEAVVKSDPIPWASAPLKTVGLLHHPTYIHHYMRGLATAESLAGTPIDELLDVVAFLRTHPWAALPLGEDSFDFDGDWRGAEEASVDLIKSLAGSDLGFGERRDEVWSILRSEVEKRDEPSGIVDARDPLESALNRPCTRALEAALSFMGHEFRVHTLVRPGALGLLASVLKLPDGDGAEHRAILAPRLGFLRHIAPDWVEKHREQLFGDTAPGGIGPLTVDLALKWGRPNSWLLENFAAQVKEAVRRDVDNALKQYLIGVLWETPGYSVSDAVGFLGSLNKLSAAGEALGRLLSTDDASAGAVTTATEIWSQALDATTTEELAGYGWFAEIGVLAEATWKDLTLRTLTANHGRIDWAHKVAERAAGSPPTTGTLAIFNELVRGLTDEWDRRRTAELAVETLNQAKQLADTLEYQRLRTTLQERGLL